MKNNSFGQGLAEYEKLYKEAVTDNPYYGTTYARVTSPRPTYYSCGLSKRLSKEELEAGLIETDDFILCRTQKDGEEYVILCRYIGQKTEVVIPDEVNEIKEFAFSDSKVLTKRGVVEPVKVEKIVFPKSLKIIQDFAFSGTNLETIDLSNVEIIGKNAFSMCQKLREVFLSDSLKQIGPAAFLLCESLKAISVPNSITILYENTFECCTNLQEVKLSDNLQYIGDYCFSKIKKLSVKVPESVETIGQGVFSENGDYSNITFAPNLFGKRTEFEVPDDEGLIFSGKVLKKCTKLNDDGILQIPEGVYQIAPNVYPIQEKASQLKKVKVILPDSVREARMLFYFGVDQDVNIPKGYLLEKKKRTVHEASDLQQLIKNCWKDKMTILDWIGVYCYQDKKFTPLCLEAFKEKPNDTICAIAAFLKSNNEKKFIIKLSELILTLRPLLEASFICDFIQTAQDNKWKDAFKILCSCNVSAKQAAKQDVETKKEYKNPVEEFCDKHYTQYELNKIMKMTGGLDEKLFTNSAVRYKDSREKASPFVLMCASLPYMTQCTLNKYEHEYHFDENVDFVASHLDINEFRVFLRTLCEGNSNAHAIAPLCRFGTDLDIYHVIKGLKKYDSHDKVKIQNAILLNEGDETKIFAALSSIGSEYSKMRKEYSSDAFYDPYRNILDEKGQKILEDESAHFVIQLEKDLSFSITDTATGKGYKSFPKEFKSLKLREEFEMLKDNVNAMKKTHIESQWRDFLQKRFCEPCSTISVYKYIDRLLVFEQNGKTLVFTENGPIDSWGNSCICENLKYEQKQSAGRTIVGKCLNPLTLAHPMEMDPEDLKRWQDYFVRNNLLQPFAQVWAPVVDFANLSKEHFKGFKFPIYYVNNMRKDANSLRLKPDSWIFEIKDVILKGDIHPDRNCAVETNQLYEFPEFDVIKPSRNINYIVSKLDELRVNEMISRDEINFEEYLNHYSPLQLNEFLEYAVRHNKQKAAKCLEDYFYQKYPNFVNVKKYII